MYECLAGTPPFTAGSSMELMYKHMREEAPKLESKAQTESQTQLAQLIERCLRKSPEDRPASISSIAAELEKICGSDSNIKEFSPARRDFWNQKTVIRAVLLFTVLLFACTFAVFSFQQSHKLDLDKTVKFKPPAKELSKVNALKSSFDELQKTLNSKPTEELRKEKLKSLVDTAIEISQRMTWSHKDGIDFLNRASNYCHENSDQDLLLKAKLIEQRAIEEGFKSQDTFESSCEEAIDLIRRATKSHVSDEEIDARKNIIMYYLSKVDSNTPEYFSKAKENYIKLEKIWSEKPITAGGDDPVIKASQQLVEQFGSFGILVDKPTLRFASCDYALEVCDFMMRRGEREKTRKWVGVIVRALTTMKDDMPKGDQHFNEMVAHAHKLQAQVLREQGELEAAKMHEDEAAALSP
jgi:serine/threonine protein kinase